MGGWRFRGRDPLYDPISLNQTYLSPTRKQGGIDGLDKYTFGEASPIPVERERMLLLVPP